MNATANQKTSMTEGVIWKKIILFAIPIFIGNVFQQLYNTVDAFIVGNYIDSNALAAVSSSGSLIFLMVGFFQGIAMGAGVIISRYFGAKEYKNLQDAIHTNVAFGFAAGLALTAIGMILTPHLLVWMDTPAEVLPNSITYFRVYFAGSMALVLYNNLVGILQAVGDSRHPLYYLVISSIINVVLDLLFVKGFGMGVGSAALATVISQAISVILCFYRLMHYETVYQLHFKKIRFHKKMLSQIIKLGLPSGVQNSIISIANVVVQSSINLFGKPAMAGCGSYSKIEGFAFLPITCFSMSLMTFVGQNLGARKYERAKKGAKFGIFCSIILAEIVGVIIFSFAPFLIGLFNSETGVVQYGITQAHIESLFFFLLAFSHCIAGIMRGAGKATVPMFTMLATWCLFRIIYIKTTINILPSVLHFERDIRAIFWAYPITWTMSSIFFLLYFLKADWLHNFDRMELNQQPKISFIKKLGKVIHK